MIKYTFVFLSWCLLHTAFAPMLSIIPSMRIFNRPSMFFSFHFISFSYSDYSDSGSDEEWPGLTPPPPLRSSNSNPTTAPSSYPKNHLNSANATAHHLSIHHDGANHTTRHFSQLTTSGSRHFDSPPGTGAGVNAGESVRGSGVKAGSRRTPSTASLVSVERAEIANHHRVAPESESTYDYVLRFLGRVQRNVKSVYDTVCALLSIKTYRYLLGGKKLCLFLAPAYLLVVLFTNIGTFLFLLFSYSHVGAVLHGDGGSVLGH